MTIDFFSLWFIPFIALSVQIATTLYFIRIRRYVGKNIRLIFTGFHILGYTYLGLIIHGLFLANERIGQQPLEIYAIFFGLLYPMLNGFLHLGLKYNLYSGLKPNPIRDMERDRQRDKLRDPIRDNSRDELRDKQKKEE